MQNERQQIVPTPRLVARKQKNLFTGYEAFVDKFKPKKTTDDCYTPAEIYDCVVEYVKQKVDISEHEIVRPFWPGEDYTSRNYYENEVVIDNPPFSIVSKIARYYVEHDVKFFLFAPHLTLFAGSGDWTRIVCGADVIYENGARVITSFISNMFGDIGVLGDSELYSALKAVQDKNKPAPLPKYKYPDEVLMVHALQQVVAQGITLSFDKSELHFVRELDCQKKHKKSIYGAGYLMSEGAKDRLVKAKQVVDKVKEENNFVFELSSREKVIVERLSGSW